MVKGTICGRRWRMEGFIAPGQAILEPLDICMFNDSSYVRDSMGNGEGKFCAPSGTKSVLRQTVKVCIKDENGNPAQRKDRLELSQNERYRNHELSVESKGRLYTLPAYFPIFPHAPTSNSPRSCLIFRIARLSPSLESLRPPLHCQSPSYKLPTIKILSSPIPSPIFFFPTTTSTFRTH